jgi:hypothetical protein
VEKNGNLHVFAESHWAIMLPLLLAASWYLGISQRHSYILFDTLFAVASSCPVAFKHITQWLSAKM